MSVDIADQLRPATRRPWRLKRRIRTPCMLAPPPKSRMRAPLLVAAVLSASTLAGALGATAIGGKRADAAAPPPTDARPERAPVAQISSVASEARFETTAVMQGNVKAAAARSTVSTARRKAAAVEDRGDVDHSALGVRARPLSDRDRGEMGAGAPQDGWKIINADRRARLRRGDVIVGACASGAPPLRAVMARLIDGSKITQCLAVLRNGEAIRLGPGETGPSP